MAFDGPEPQLPALRGGQVLVQPEGDHPHSQPGRGVHSAMAISKVGVRVGGVDHAPPDRRDRRRLDPGLGRRGSKVVQPRLGQVAGTDPTVGEVDVRETGIGDLSECGHPFFRPSFLYDGPVRLDGREREEGSGNRPICGSERNGVPTFLVRASLDLVWAGALEDLDRGLGNPIEADLTLGAAERKDEGLFDLGARGTDEEADLAGFDLTLPGAASIGGEVGMHFQDDGAGGAGRQHDAGRPDQLPGRPGHLRYGVLEVDLDDLGR